MDIEALLVNERWVARLARALVRDDDEADDVVQDARVAFWRRGPRGPSSARSWLGTVVRNLSRNRARDARARAAAHAGATAPDDAVPSAEVSLERLEVHRRLAGLVAALDAPYRQALVMRYYEGLSAADIARRLGLPAGTVRWRVKTGLDRLRAKLDQQHEQWRTMLLPLADARPHARRSFTLARPLVAGAVVVTAVALVGMTRRGPPAPSSSAAVSSPARPGAASPARASAQSSRRASALLRFVLPALAAAGRQPAAAPDASRPRITREQARQIAARKPAGGLDVTVDDGVLAALDRLVGSEEARAATREALARLDAHRAAVDEVFDGFGVPRELAAVALLESGFDDAVVSERSGATGVWQFTRRTAEAYGLATGDDADERLDPRRATEAAAALMADLHRRLGSWDLAIAAYNQGARAVANAVAEAGTSDVSALQARGLLAPYRSGVMAAVLVMREPALAQ